MPPSVQNINMTSSTILRVMFMLLAFWVLYVIRDVVIMIIAAVIIAFAMEPLTRRLQAWRIPRGVSVVIVYAALIALLAAAVVLIVPAVAEQTVDLANQAPDLLVGLEQKIGTIPGVSSEEVASQLQQILGRIGNNLANYSSTIVQQTRSFFSGFLSIIFVFVIAFYLVIEQSALKKMFRYVVPRQHMAYVELIIDRIEYKLGRWVLGQMVLGIVVGLSVGIVLWILGVKYALALGLIAGILEVLPVIGPLVSGIIGTLIALSQSFFLGIGALIMYVVIQQLENQILVPNIMKKATGLNPLVTLLAVLLGGRLAGFVGVILSVPIATIISIILADFFSTAAGDDELAG